MAVTAGEEKVPVTGARAMLQSTPEDNMPTGSRGGSTGRSESESEAEETINAAYEYSDEYYRKLLWKIDLFLLPLMWFSYGTQQADKNSLSTQAVFGIREDTHLQGDQFNWLSTAFYLAYLVFEAPGNWIMQRVHLGRFLGSTMVLWGVIVLVTAFAKNFTHLIVLRIIQGALECIVSPAFLLIVGSWYKSREHAFRSVIWGTSNGGVSIITGVISYAIAEKSQTDPNGLAAWKGISLFLGALTIFLGILVFFILGTPREVTWLNKDEKRAAIARIVENKTGSDREKRSEFKWDQARQAFKDPQTYFLFFITIINALPGAATAAFGNLVFQSFGFTPKETLLKGTSPMYAVGIVWFLVCGWLSMKFPNTRFILMMASLLPAFTGLLALGLLPVDTYMWTKWGLYLMQATGPLPGLLIWTFVPSNVAGRTKKTVVTTVLFVAYSTGAAIGGQILRPEDAPRFLKGLTAAGILYGVEFVGLICWRYYYIYENRRRAKLIEAMGITPEESERLGKLNAELDMTDQENIHFKYQV
ncbi:MFS general substrate transporter [Astrocystis sublimbata]|nr:MFS general substrate transporter [Astrocystis sublimbata]